MMTREMSVSRVPGWPEVYDFKFPNLSLTAYLIEILQGWAAFGFDGFRVDVASFMPQNFWLQARREVAKVKPGIIWLAETVHVRNVELRRMLGLPAVSDGEVYQAFDITYDNDIWAIWRAALAGKVTVSQFLEMLRFQDCCYPLNFVKMRCVENHDRARITTLVRTLEQVKAWTAFQAFNKGAFLIYSGQESCEEHGHFDGDRIEWGDYPLQPFLTTLCALKKGRVMTEGAFVITAADPAIQATWYTSLESLYGVFNVNRNQGDIKVLVPDGSYMDILSGDQIKVENGKMDCPQSACIFSYQPPKPPRPFFSDLLDFDLAEYLPAP